MKKYLLLPVLTLCFFALKAQLPNNSIAPNFTAIDINGNSHELYAYLDSGYTVILDLSAAWCAPCWTVHESGLLQDIHDQYGPNGTNEMRVFYIESESTNTIDQLHGVSSGTAHSTFSQGDWVGTHTFPFIDDASIANAYQLGAFPTIFAITPERLTTVFVGSPAPSVQDFYDIALASNGVATSAVDPLMLNYSGENTTICGSFDAAVNIQNHGTNVLSSMTVELIENGTTIATENWTGNLDPYELTTVTFNNISVSQTADIDAKITSIDDVLTNNELTFTIAVLKEKTVLVQEDMEDGSGTDLPSDVYYGVNDFNILTLSKNDFNTPPAYEIGAFGNSSKSLVFDFYNNDSGSSSVMVDKLVIPSFADSAKLEFSYAYTGYDGSEQDRLNVEVSTDCGATWSNIFNKAGSALQTTTATTSFFVPNTTEWEKVSVDLMTYAGSTVIVRFVGTTDYGNTLYLDDINIKQKSAIVDVDLDGYDSFNDCDDNNAAVNPGATEIPGNGIDDDCDPSTSDIVGINEIDFVNDLQLAPIPAKTQINLSFELVNNDKVQISIVSLDGKVIATRTLNNTKVVNEAFNVSNVSNGVYFMKINTNNASSVRKFIVSK